MGVTKVSLSVTCLTIEYLKFIVFIKQVMTNIGKGKNGYLQIISSTATKELKINDI